MWDNEEDAQEKEELDLSWKTITETHLNINWLIDVVTWMPNWHAPAIAIIKNSDITNNWDWMTRLKENNKIRNVRLRVE